MPGPDQRSAEIDNPRSELHQARDELERLVLIEDFSSAVKSAEALLERSPPTDLEANVRLLLARAWVRLNDGGQAFEYARQARLMFVAAGDRMMAAEALLEEARALGQLDDPRTLLRALQALDLCEHLQPEHRDLMVRILIHMGIVYYRYSDWAKAVESCDRALELAREEPNLRLLARTHSVLSACHQHLANHSAAVEHGRRAYALFSRSVEPTDMARAENNLGLLYVRLGRLDEAGVHLTRALDLTDHDPASEAYLRADVLCSVAELHLARHELQAAETRLGEARELSERRHEQAGEAYATHLTARLHLQLGDFAAADAAFAQAETLFETLGLTDRLADCNSEHAHALQRQGRMEEAIDHMRAAYEAVSAGPNKLAAAMQADEAATW